MVAGARPRVPFNGPPSVTTGAAPSSGNADSAVTGRRPERAQNELDVDMAGYRQFDEESFSEVITYYGNTNNLQVRLQFIHYLCQGCYVMPYARLSVCLSVC